MWNNGRSLISLSRLFSTTIGFLILNSNLNFSVMKSIQLVIKIEIRLREIRNQWATTLN